MFKEITPSETQFLEVSRFREMDYYAVGNYHLPIELMMENAGLQLANLVAHSTPSKRSRILIGIGNGNNGGGGLVAARRLSAWGYQVHLDLATDIDKELPKRQLERAKAFGAEIGSIEKPAIWVDAYLGFSQKPPLRGAFLDRVNMANSCKDCLRISLDLPTGFLGDIDPPYFQADKLLTLAMAKKILLNLPVNQEIYIADLGIPEAVYSKFDVEIPPFRESNILKLVR